ncbi:MAG TPA: hypothetical protein VMV75_02700 [Sulfuricella sp.]|nr:hypothetical protein [Sulfuricella sp.]
MVAAYFTPVWWVSLTAPNYPKEAFPDGIRIHFHFNGVFNGCKVPAPKKGSHSSEILQSDLGDDLTQRAGSEAGQGDVEVGLNCVHEMNTINHYVGMYPIDTGAPVEVPMSKFFFGFFTVMLLAFMAVKRRNQLLILGVGFAAVAAWMIVDQFVLGQLNQFAEHYYHEASTFFNQPEILLRWTANLRLATKVAVAGLIAAMAIVMLGVWKIRGFTLILALVPALLPVFFVLDYAGWLWFFGHNLHPWGAFTVKPFMPTVFGEGKVAQFSTYSYPYYGYALLTVQGAVLFVALLIRRKMLREEQS